MATTTSHQIIEQITNEKDIPKFATVISEAFSNDPLNRFFYLGRDSRPGHPKLLEMEKRTEYWQKAIKARFDAGGILIQSMDWAAAALWLAPGTKKPLPDTNAPEGVEEYRQKFDAMKKQFLGESKYWYLNLIGRSPSRPDKGAVRALFEPYLEKAREQNLPVWLETTTPHGRQVYEHLGFKTVGEVRIAEGIANGEGWAQEGGSGVLCWGMMISTEP